LTFPGAVLAVKIVWYVITALWPAGKGFLWIPAALAFLLGAAIALYSITDPELRYAPRDRRLAYVVGFLNSCFLAATVLGFNATEAAMTGATGAGG
jgi:hypothetical protein